jgi:4-amino-4-deoxy-L-arabinose transferase-like glycosyltransferase
MNSAEKPAEPDATHVPGLQVLPRWLGPALCALIAVLFLVRNLPWHLDDYDQAKQAFVSFEMVETGHWIFQHTPSGKIATKPPLAGWISAGAYHLLGGSLNPLAWPLAWRIPSLLVAAFLIRALWRLGNSLAGTRLGGPVAVAAFALTVFTPRLASLVRTDMLLTASITAAGLIVLQQVRAQSPWSPRARWGFFASILASMLLKGPIAFAFLLPGLAAFALFSKDSRRFAWAGFIPWIAPLLLFLLWAGIGIAISPEFYEQVVLREFLGRFQTGETAVHQPRNPFFYVGLLLLRWQPWGLLLAFLCALPEIRRRFREPAVLWLACWGFGGLLFMSLIPSKRFDRILPAIPPLCLLLSAWIPTVASSRFPSRTVHRLALGSVGAAALFSSAYAISKAIWAYSNHQSALVDLGKKALELAAHSPAQVGVVRGGDEGLLLYTHQTRFLSEDAARKAWASGTLRFLIVPEKSKKTLVPTLPNARQIAQTGKIEGKASAYLLLEKTAP